MHVGPPSWMHWIPALWLHLPRLYEGVLPPWSSHVGNPSSRPVTPLVSGSARITISFSLAPAPGLLVSTVPSGGLFAVTIRPSEMFLPSETAPPPHSARKEKISTIAFASCYQAEWLQESEMVTFPNINILYILERGFIFTDLLV